MKSSKSLRANMLLSTTTTIVVTKEEYSTSLVRRRGRMKWPRNMGIASRIACTLFLIMLLIYLYLLQSTPLAKANTITTFSPQAATATTLTITSTQLPNETEVPISRNKSSAPVLRPSLEEVASKLSKKHLNLEHENWRLKQTPSSGNSGEAEQPQEAQQHEQEANMTLPTSAYDDDIDDLSVNSADRQPNSQEKQAMATTQQEQQLFSGFLSSTATTASATTVTTAGNKINGRHPATAANSSTDSVISSRQIASKISSTQAKQSKQQQQQQQNSSRRRKKILQNYYEDSDLLKCHQYLQFHSSASPLQTSGQQHLPCSCEWRKPFSLQMSESDNNRLSTSLSQPSPLSVWLSCDHVQLIGSHLYQSISNHAYETLTDSMNTSKRFNNNNYGDKYSSLTLTKFSQRDSGLQTLHSQKFHYLQLFHLKSIDLSNNRIRKIKMDAFHGLETKLEHLNLAYNLLGDSRAIYDDNNHNHNDVHSFNYIKSNGRLIFSSEELNRLKRLKWLSLANNQINQLAPSIFIKHHYVATPGSIANTALPSLQVSISAQASSATQQSAHNSEQASELTYLDLSENLLKLVPSDSIILLNKLEILKLNGNRIGQLNQASKFPSSLKYLDLSENLISHVRQCDLIDLPNLIELNLAHNQLSQLDKSAFVSAASLVNSAQLSLATANHDHNHRDHNQGRQQHTSDSYGRRKRETKAAQEDAQQEQQVAAQLTAAAALDADQEENLAAELDDLEADESIMSAAAAAFTADQVSSRQTISDQLNSMASVKNRFNSTRLLNLSYNFFESLPGDSLLKFTNLQQLDISFNRIRRLDSNYLCSIYNLVENLRKFDLSGNLLTTNNVRQLNRLFGCLQKLEQLSLSTNRLAITTPVNNDQQQRLAFKFGDNFASRYLNMLDLSDNQLKSMPIIEQVLTQPAISSSTSNIFSSSEQQQTLNQWLDARGYLEVLNLNLNYIERLDESEFENLFNLRQLNLDSNRLSALPAKLMRRFTSLDKLSLNGNRIASLAPLDELFERSMKTLRMLNLGNNRLLEWPQISGKSFLVTTRGSQATATTSGSSVDHHYFALEELNIEGNLLTSGNITTLFDQLIYMKSLKILNLSYNLLNKVRSDWFKYANKNLQRLILTGNKINTIELGSFAADQVNELTHLNLDYNLLKELKRRTFDSMPKIRELNLANNIIHTINSETFYQVNSLQVLKLNNNKLTGWKCEYFANLCNSLSGNINADLASLLGHQSNVADTINAGYLLQPAGSIFGTASESGGSSHQSASVSSLIELDLSYNSLSQLRANSISVHTKLVKLNLEHNKLSFIPHDVFKATASGSTLGHQQAIQLVSSLKYLNLAHNRIQTIDDINFRPLKNLLSLDLSNNELQTLGSDVVFMDSKSIQREQNKRRVIVSNNLTNLLLDDDEMFNDKKSSTNRDKTSATGNNDSSRSMLTTPTNWPALAKLRNLNLANNQLTSVNQSLLSELSPFALLNLNLSFNYLDSDSLPYGFYSKISGATFANKPSAINSQQPDSSSTKQQTNYDLVFALKLENLDLSYNRLNELPTNLLENHYTSLESCNLAHNRIQNLVENSNFMIQIKSLNLDSNPLSLESNELVLFEQRSTRHLNLAATRLFAIQQTAADQQTSFAAAANSHQRHHQLDLIRSINKPIDAPYLRHLNLSSNQLVWLAANVFDKIHSLQTIDLSNNQLTRLHLLNNQLAHVSPSLEYLNLASNLLTNLESNDFSQLGKLRYLDLSNLLSLQKMNCKFLAKLTTLKTLRMLNYPQLRQTMNNLQLQLNSINNNGNEEDSFSRLERRKLRNELIMSTIGLHCFQAATDNLPLAVDSKHFSLESSEEEEQKHGNRRQREQDEFGGWKWFNLNELELELFTSSRKIGKQHSSGGGFELKDELGQLIGPQLRKLTLVGLNLTSLSEESLIGITNNELELKISYTSLAQLPLRQVLNSVPKRTKLNLDLRNNNIQSIDTKNLLALDELQLNQQILERGDHSSLRLGSNPFRCDCNARPLWLWLNQRWGNVELPQVSEDSHLQLSGDTPASNIVNSWLKLNSISQSDLKCYYPMKLRGKLTQLVYYNDLICKSSLLPTTLISGINNISKQQLALNRRRAANETRPSVDSSGSYHSTATIDLADSAQTSGDWPEEDLDYYNSAEPSTNTLDSNLSGSGGTVKSTAAGAQQEPLVRVTKFNRFPLVLGGNSSNLLFLLNAIPVPFVQDKREISFKSKEETIDQELRGSPEYSAPSAVREGNSNNNFQTAASTNYYNKHRPNIHQRHSHYSTLTAYGKSSASFAAFSSTRVNSHTLSSLSSVVATTKHSLLTESDLLILTVMSIAMLIMSLIIITICLFKYKMDQTDKERILTNTQSKLQLPALIHQPTPPALFGVLDPSVTPFTVNSKQLISCDNAATTTGNSNANKHANSASRAQSDGFSSDNSSSANNANNKSSIHNSKQRAHRQRPATYLHPQQHQQSVLVPIGSASSVLVPTSGAQNFLMRSPTIRRMRGLATNASDWFKYTLRAYPPTGAASHRRRLFIGNPNAPNGSQWPIPTVSAAEEISVANQQQQQQQQRQQKQTPESESSKVLSATLAAGCPLHAFKSIKRLRDSSKWRISAPLPELDQCLYCAQLLTAVQQTRPQFVITMEPDNKSQRQTTEDSKGATRIQSNQNNVSKFSSSASSSPSTEATSFLSHATQKKLPTQSLNSSPGVIYHSREQQAKAMRTFGYNSSGTNQSSFTSSTKGRKAEMPTTTATTTTTAAATMATQVKGDAGPTYHLESQIPTIDVDGRFAYQTEREAVRFCNPADIVAAGEVSDSIVNDGDECSRSSSPVAYGFMRSSPSATTLSSSERNISPQKRINFDNDSEHCTSSRKFEENEDQIIISRL